MPIYTSYLAYLRKFNYNPLKIFPDSLESVLIYYVMHSRGNDEVAPWAETVQVFKAGRISWEGYRTIYMRKIDTPNGREWMEKRAKEANAGHHVILVCFEKNPEQCHRRLLAEAIVAKFGAKYEGELSKFQ
jgi:uncharacterized protein YeaO (DUF488 family)